MGLVWSLSALALVASGILLMLGRSAAAWWLGIRAVLVPLAASFLFHLVPGLPSSVLESLVNGLSCLLAGLALAGLGYVLWQRRGLPRERLLPRDRALPPPPRFDTEER